MTDALVPPPLPPAPAPLPPTAAAPAPAVAVADWQRLPEAAAQLAMAGGLLRGLVFGIAASVFLTFPLRDLHAGLSFGAWALVLAGGVVAACVLGTWLGYRGWRSSAWKLDATGLHVRRGVWWRKEVLVPRSRVQHLDIERGPIERNFGLATLVVHTAGSRVHALRQPGFADADAVALRDVLVPDSARHDDVL
jgi:membrane protein YdbS with pleckstrin-like domain